ncbi:MAG: hypothetical protein KKA54_20345 [Proteobacteria bacterium]|nr:hypothetical protein [Pseudomonadota bacterium]MBU0968717.1 hypothetical protein [Pseudomonadota bacterium]
MVEGKKKDSLLSQILVAVAIALLAGGTAPWWWSELKDVFRMRTGESPATSVERPPTEPPVESLRRALEDYEAVHALYGQSRPADNCVEIRDIVEHIRLYVGNERLVPESFRYTVRYPTPKSVPTISDLATDRITRIKNTKSQCFD